MDRAAPNAVICVFVLVALTGISGILGLDGWAKPSPVLAGQDPIEALAPDVKLSVTSGRLLHDEGICEIFVQDVSPSVESQDNAIGQNSAVVLNRFGMAAPTSSDWIGSVTFSDSATSDGPKIGTSYGPIASIAAARVGRPGTTTIFATGWDAASRQLKACPAGMFKHITLVTDGYGDPDVAHVPGAVEIDVLNISGGTLGDATGSNRGDWSAAWREVPARSVTQINGNSADEVVAGYAAVLGRLTGIRYDLD